MAWTRRSGSSLFAGLLVLIWLMIGVVAAVQRGYFGSSSADCAKVSTTVVTIIAGPLNYVGANPKVDCKVPQPSE
jgi:LytS/YehU family sensor histidine kinase